MSGTSTPRGGDRSPAPDGAAASAATAAAGPSPLTIGKRFVKQYYQTLMTTPDQIYRFYQPKSVLSDGEGSSPTDPVLFESVYDGTSADQLKNRFFVPDLQIRFEFEHGAIDAQQSVNGGLLLVVTGHVVYDPMASEDEDAAVEEPVRKGFVHTFFLNVHTSGTKKSFYVHNDILRFLKNPADVVASSSSINSNSSDSALVNGAAVLSEPVQKEPTKTKEEPAPVKAKPEPTLEPSVPPKVAAAAAPTKKEAVDEAPGGGIEESKEDAPLMAPASTAATTKEDKASSSSVSKKGAVASKKDATAAAAARAKSPKRNNNNNNEGRKSPVPPSSPAPKPAPGSWASLVARPSASPVKAPAAPATTTTPSSSSSKPSSKDVSSSQPSVLSSSNDDKKKDSSGGRNTNSNNTTTNKDHGNNSSNNKNTNGSSNNNNNNNNTSSGGRPQIKRDPDCTLVIKNLAEGVKESDVLGVFEAFATDTKTKVVGITVSAHRGIAFVDYDSVRPVHKAVEQHKKEALRLMGRVLEVDQKTAEQRARKAAQRQGSGGGGGNYNNNNSNGRYGGGSGGRGRDRRRDGGGGGRGDRDGGGGGRGGGGGGSGGGRGGRGGR